MTNKIDRTKTKTKSVGARTLAMVLCFVMLLTAIGSGSVLSAIAAGFDKGDAAVLANAVKLGADVSAAKAEDKASDEPFVDDIEDGFTLSKKTSDADLAVTGREADITNVGWSDYDWVCAKGAWKYNSNGYYEPDSNWNDLSMTTLNNGYFFDDHYFLTGTGDNAYWYDFYYRLGKGSEWNDKAYPQADHSFNASSGTQNYDNLQNGTYHKFTLKVLPSSTTYTKVTFSFNPSSNKSVITQNAVTAISASYTNNTATVAPNEAINMYPDSISGGTGGRNVNYLVKNSSNTDVTSTVMNNGYFKSATPGTYTVTTTVTDSTLSSITQQITKTVTVRSVDWHIVGLKSYGGNSAAANNRMVETSTGSGVYYIDVNLTNYNNEADGAGDGKFHLVSTAAGALTNSVHYGPKDASDDYVIDSSHFDIDVTMDSQNSHYFKNSNGAGSYHITYTPSTNKFHISENLNGAFYLGGYLNGSEVTTKRSTYAFTETADGSGIYTLTYSATQAQYATVIANDGTVYHPKPINAPSGTPAMLTDTSGNGDPKWNVNSSSGQTIVYTWDTNHTNPILSWKLLTTGTTGGGTDHGTLDNTAKLFIGLDDNNNLSQASVSIYKSGNDYYMNLTDMIGEFKAHSNNYFAFTTTGSKNDISTSDITISIDTGTTYVNSNGQQESYLNTGSNHKFARLQGIKSGAKGIALTYNSSSKKYSFVVSGAAISDEGGGSGGEITGTQITVYAKDGSIRVDEDNAGKTYANIADTKIYHSDGTTTTGVSQDDSNDVADQTYEHYQTIAGDTVVIKTTIASAYKDTYYVRGFCVNGETYYGNNTKGVNTNKNTNNADGVYTLTYTIPENISGESVEITPIYYLVNDSNCVTYIVQGFNDTLKGEGWGNTLYAYPFYGKLSSNNNAFGAYPGQPLVFTKGQYSMQVPLQSTAFSVWKDDTKGIPAASRASQALAEAFVHSTYVSGITMSNGFFDKVHREVMHYDSEDKNNAAHLQTYDYDDFYKIYNEKNTLENPVDNIVYVFKPEYTKDNKRALNANQSNSSEFSTNSFGTSSKSKSSFTDTFTNGFEQLQNFHGRNVNIFGNPLSGSSADVNQTNPLYVISAAGYRTKNTAGNFATEWFIYKPSAKTGNATYSLVNISGGKQAIPPALLLLNDANSFNNTTYPTAVDGYNTTDWKSYYNLLASYSDYPVMISYEKVKPQKSEDEEDATGKGGATRYDGRWLYSSNGENITANIEIQTSHDNGKTYAADTTTTGLSAYFTDNEALGETTFNTTSNPDLDFNFEASSTNANYRFVGWYIKGGTLIDTDNASATARTGSMTLLARFKEVTAGSLTLSHIVDTNATYKGAAVAEMKVVATNSDTGTTKTFSYTTNDINLDESIITSNNASGTVTVTLKLTPSSSDDIFHHTETAAAAGFFNGATSHAASQWTHTGTPYTYEFSFNVSDLYSGTTQNVKALQYKSYLSRPTYSYNLQFKFYDRSGSEKVYTRQASLSDSQITAYVESNGSNRYIDTGFLIKLAPYESNFNQTLNWNFSEDSNRQFTKEGDNYVLTKTYNAYVVTEGENIRSTSRTVTFSLPYAHTNGVATLTDGKVVKTDNNQALPINNLNYGDLIKYNNNYIVAPEVIYDNDTMKFFNYWSIKVDNQLVAKCYSDQFNYLLYDNYIITPVYEDSKVDFVSEGASTSISYLETSRNQWNGTGSATDNKDTAADILYNDFILNYGYGDMQIKTNNQSVQDRGIEVGLVVDRMCKLQRKGDNSADTTASHYIPDSDTDTRNSIINLIKGNETTSGTLTQYKVNNTELDNKNRLQFYYALYNTTGWTNNESPATSYGYKNYVYRAYSYIKYTDDGVVTQVKLCDNPAYFLIYDEATK